MKTPPFFSVVFEDEHIIAVNKASGIAVSADRWDDSAQRIDKLVESTLPEGQRLFRLHRIDRDTSGLVVFAKTSECHRILSVAFEERQVYKRYIAVVGGRPPWTQTSCDFPLIPNGNKKHMTIIDNYRGKKSLTNFRLLGSAGNYSVVEALPETGRTHQIRVHLAALGFPVVCDPLYGKIKPVMLSSFKRDWRGDPLEEKPLLARLGLHAAELHLPDYLLHRHESETSAEQCNSAASRVLEAPLAKDMAALIKQMGNHIGQALLPAL